MDASATLSPDSTRFNRYNSSTTMTREFDDRRSVDYRDHSLISPRINDSSVWNENWRSTNDDQFPSNDNLPTEEVAFFPPRKFGERAVDLSVYWTSGYIRASIVLTVVLTVMLTAYRLTAALSVTGSFNFVWIFPYAFWLCLISFSNCSIYLRDYVHHFVETNTRFQAFVNLMSINAIVELSKFAFGGAFLSWIFASQFASYYQWPFLTGDFESNSRAKYLNEEHLYLFCSGIWCGVLLYCRRHFDLTRPRIRFPVVRRSKIAEFKGRARPSLKKSTIEAFWPSLLFTVVYHFVLSDLKHVVVRSSLFLDSTTLDIDKTWYELFNLRRFIVVYLSTAMVVFSFKMSKFLTRLYVLVPKEFVVELFHEGQKGLSLTEGLSEARLPLVKALAFQYLLTIAQRNDVDSKERRRKIYSLNPTSEIPAEWRAVKSDCLTIIDRFSQELDRFSGLAASANSRRPYDGVFPKQLALRAIRLKLQNERLVERRQNMSRLEWARYRFDKTVDNLPGLNYLFGDDKENSFQRTVRDSQLALYSIRALSCLVAKSVVEDKYGVVQRDVPQILSSLTAVEAKLSSLRTVSQLCSAYSVFVRRSLVRIWLAFPDSYGVEGLRRLR